MYFCVPRQCGWNADELCAKSTINLPDGFHILKLETANFPVGFFFFFICARLVVNSREAKEAMTILGAVLLRTNTSFVLVLRSAQFSLFFFCSKRDAQLPTQKHQSVANCFGVSLSCEISNFANKTSKKSFDSNRDHGHHAIRK